ncbi:MAG TPA: hypothetical protein VD999_02765 [Vitreimonas sp.]|nr:hypothetical protein [Vitreimonas sp.]
MPSKIEPDFFLASSEGYDLEEPKKCYKLRRVSNENRDDMLLVKVEPPLVGQGYGLGGKDVDTLLIIPRHVGASLFPINEWPLYVHVALVPLDRINQNTFSKEEIKPIAWAELYPTWESAKSKSIA